VSWGERSCKLYGSCTHKPEIQTCNVDCPHYGWNGATKPDSTPRTNREILEGLANEIHDEMTKANLRRLLKP
jgi:hypothetical protein